MASSSMIITPPIAWGGPSICISATTVRPSIRKPQSSIRNSYRSNDNESRISASPWLMLPPSFECGNTAYNFYNLTNKKVVNLSVPSRDEAFCSDTEVVGSSHGFLALFHKRNHKLFLYNPVSLRFIDLPSIHTLSLADIGLGPLDMRVTKVIISDDVSRAVMIFGPANRLAFCCPGRSTEWTPLGALFIEEEFRMYARVYSDIVYSKREKVFTCYTDHDMEEWDLRLSRAGQQVNLVYQLRFKKYLPAWWWYGISQQFNLKKYLPAIKDVMDFKFKKYLPWWYGIKDLIDYCNKEAYVVLAEHSNQIYVVYRYIMERSLYVENKSRYELPVRGWDDSYPHKTIGFSVYKVARVGDNTVQLDYMEEGSLHNLVIFLGRNHSFALPAQHYPELKPDSIYFTDNPRHTPLDWQTYGNAAYDTAIYYYNDRTFSPLFDSSHHNNVISSIKGTVPPPLWFTPSPNIS